MGASELPETPSEEEFKLFLKNGIVLCNMLNKIHPGAISQVIYHVTSLFFEEFSFMSLEDLIIPCIQVDKCLNCPSKTSESSSVSFLTN